ncbi:uncharacterized protein TERG_00215 [Trichophyton rubrum CBS 118892]|uniref:Uncharacterized protein n=1 Tax=Trichophyton rubrum (strain ATCC MYA-4607 / CBS 118892) TaxID=559305 RepID=F2SEJ2_TRIRC|nr:uncharacterized protein TERG_00215 [Trichophyton rubrum CBS 118892]EGD83934.2 hypothetical protein TERG_00215 [Trichophyton rubrum CBS 118892]
MSDKETAPVQATEQHDEKQVIKDVAQDPVLDTKAGSDIDAEKGEGFETPDGEEPTESEKFNLRHIGESLPLSAWLVAVVELCERFTYYGMNGLFQNYIQRPFDGSEGVGALGLGHQGATGLTTFFQFWCYVTPIFGAIVADQYLGKYKAILYFCFVYMAGLIILVATSVHNSLAHGAGLGGFIASIIIIGIGTGGIKSNVAPLIADQYKRRVPAVSTLSTGERVIIDPAITIQRIYMIFYACINIGSLSLLATPYMELYIGFWSAYLLCLCVFVVGTVTLILGRKAYVVRPPTGSIITNAFSALWIMITSRNMERPQAFLPGRARQPPHRRLGRPVCRRAQACPSLPARSSASTQSTGSFTTSSPVTSSPRPLRWRGTASPTISCRTSTPLPFSSSSPSSTASSTRSCRNFTSHSHPSPVSPSVSSLPLLPWPTLPSSSTSSTAQDHATSTLSPVQRVRSTVSLWATTSISPSRPPLTCSSVSPRFLPPSPVSNTPTPRPQSP